MKRRNVARLRENNKDNFCVRGDTAHIAEPKTCGKIEALAKGRYFGGSRNRKAGT